MSGARDQDRLQDLLDGLLSPSEAEELERAVQADPALRQEQEWMRAVHRLLDEPLDVDPPAGLHQDILAAVRAASLAPEPARRKWLSRRTENALVLCGAVALSMAVGLGRVTGLDWVAPWVGRVIVGAADGVSLLTRLAMSVQELEWTVRLASTLSDAGLTLLGTSSDLLTFVGVASVLTTTILAWGLTRGGRLLKGGVGHAHLLS